ncbi:MAG: four helix bundle protein [Mariniphaga sp.]|nr:four helix bundle protein [Mariniphaga sp.]
MTKNELEERLIDFAVKIIKFCKNLPDSREGIYIAGQLTRSGCSTALNFGEAQDAESLKDLIHKNKIILKELRETRVALKICLRAEISTNQNENNWLINESNELISIFVVSNKKLRNKI